MKVRILFIALFLISLLIGTSDAFAEDMVLDARVQQVSKHMDKNGRAYTRIIIEDTRSLNGITYTTGTPVMAFGNAHTEAGRLRPNSNAKMIVEKGNYKGKTSYRLLKVLN